MIEEECSDSNHPGGIANISSNTTMISVEFSLKEEMLVVLDEVHEMMRTVEMLITHLLCWSGSASRRESWRWPKFWWSNYQKHNPVACFCILNISPLMKKRLNQEERSVWEGVERVITMHRTFSWTKETLSISSTIWRPLLMELCPHSWNMSSKFSLKLVLRRPDTPYRYKNFIAKAADWPWMRISSYAVIKWNLERLPGGSSQGTLWTLLDSMTTPG